MFLLLVSLIQQQLSFTTLIKQNYYPKYTPLLFGNTFFKPAQSMQYQQFNTRMDLGKFQTELYRLTKDSDRSEESIGQIVEFCLSKGVKYTLPICKMIQNLMDCYTIEYRMGILRIMSGLIMGDKSKGYARHLSPRILCFLGKLSFDIYYSQEAFQTLKGLFKTWRMDRVFVLSFFNRLFDQLGSLKQRLMEDQANFFNNYSKKFVENVRGVRKMKIGDKIYKDLAESHLLKKQVDELHSKQADLPIIEAPVAQATNSAKELLLTTDHLLIESIRVLLSFQSSCQQIATMFQQQKNSLLGEQ